MQLFGYAWELSDPPLLLLFLRKLVFFPFTSNENFRLLNISLRFQLIHDPTHCITYIIPSWIRHVYITGAQDTSLLLYGLYLTTLLRVYQFHSSLLALP